MHAILLGRMYFTGDDGYRRLSMVIVFAPMFSSLISDSDKGITD